MELRSDVDGEIQAQHRAESTRYETGGGGTAEWRRRRDEGEALIR